MLLSTISQRDSDHASLWTVPRQPIVVRVSPFLPDLGSKPAIHQRPWKNRNRPQPFPAVYMSKHQERLWSCDSIIIIPSRRSVRAIIYSGERKHFGHIIYPHLI